MEPDDIERVRHLAGLVDCVTEEDVRLLAGATGSTVEAWRKRGKGPAYILLGNRYLYPRTSLKAFLDSRLRERAHVPAKGML